MLFLSDASLVVFFKFLQILLWISIPAFIIGMLITTWIHYRNKRRRLNKTEEQHLFENGSKILSGYDDPSLLPGEFFLPGSKQEQKKIIDHLLSSKAEYIARQKGAGVLYGKYQQFSETIKNKTMEPIQTGMIQTLQEQIDNLKKQHEFEKKELYAELTQLTEVYENLELDNNNLRDQLSAYSSDKNETTTIIQKWEEEKGELKKRIGEQEYLKDVLEEKKLQIVFLQRQLEQRIKNHHLVEQQFRDLGIKFMEVKEELEIQQQTNNEFQSGIDEREKELIFLKEKIQSKTEQAEDMEYKIKDLQAEKMKFTIELDERKDLINNLLKQLSESDIKKLRLEEKLEKHQIFFKGFHQMLSEVHEEESEKPPVITMKPLYVNENEGQELTEQAIP